VKRILRRLAKRVANFVTRRRGDERLREEMEEHLALQTEENLRAGTTPVEARRQAILKFGVVEAVREEYQAEKGLPLFENLLQDARYTLRTFAKSPGFVLVAILTMALGIGATTAIFSLVDATLLHPLRFPHPEKLVRMEDDLTGVGARDIGLSIPEWRDLQRAGIFKYVSLVGGGSVNLTGSAQPARILFEPVTPNYFALLGVKPELGRWFDPTDQTPGFTLEVVLSDGLWKRAFGGDPQILGRSLRLDNDAYRVVGVMPPEFHDPGRTPDERNAELWAATGFAADPAPPPARNVRLPLGAIARLNAEETLAEAQSRLDALVASLTKRYPADYPPESAWRVRLTPLKESLVGNVRQPLLLLLGAVGAVLLIGCVNVANLLLARASARGREMAVRQTLGAGRMRLARQLLTESLLLSLLGGLAGFGVLFCAKSFLLRMVPENLPRLSDVSIDWNVLLFALVASVVAGTLFGLAPALEAGRRDLAHKLKVEGRGTTGSREQARTRRVLVVTEFALSLVLMIAAGLLLRSFWDLFRVQLGFDPQNVTAVRLWLPIPNDPTTDIYGTPAQEARFLREILRRCAALPGVKEIAVGRTEAIPLHHERNLYPLTIEGRDVRGSQAPMVQGSSVTPGYFHLLGIPLERGRAFSEQDNENAPPVAVINAAMARTYWPNADPVGKRFQLNPSKPVWIEVVGVVADARTESLEYASVPQVYLSLLQRRDKELAIFLRGKLDAAAIPEEVRAEVQSVNPELPVFGAVTLPEVVAGSIAQRRFSMELVLLFAGTALLLAGLGIYGTISYLVSERRHEIGIRLALGARPGAILRMVLRQGLELAMAGAAVGLAGALLVSHLMAGLLYGVTPTDPATFAGVTAVLTAAALVACFLPAWRAMRLDPLVAMRDE
jgi:predicted permease